MTDLVLPFAEALAAVLTQAKTLAAPASKAVPLTAADNRVLAAPVVAVRDQPPFDRSTRDGYAIRGVSELATAGGESSPRRIAGSVRAGEAWDGEPLQADTTTEIMTGAPVPEGTEAVVMVEHTSVADGSMTVKPEHAVKPGDNIVPRGAEARAGETLLPAGRALYAAEIAVAASCGASTVRVFAEPRVAIIATGDELAELGQEDAPRGLGPSEIYNSNSYALAALVRGEGGFAARLPIARDTHEDLRQRLEEAMPYDLILLSGGVSMGKYDLVEEVLAAFDAEFFFTGALIQPGKPIVFGRLRGSEGPGPYFFGLPGNPVSTQVCFHLFVAPLLRALAGRTDLEPTFVEARLEEEVKGGARVTRFLPAELTGRWDGATVRLTGWQGSGDVAANARGNCYCVLPAAVERFAKGKTVRLLLR